MDKTNAYQKAYPDSTDSKVSASVNSVKLEHNTRIALKIRDMVAAKMPQTSLVPEIDKNFVLNGIATLAKSAEKENVRLSAFIALAKMPHIGLYEGATDPDDKPKSIADIDAKLAEYFKRMTTIEGDATRVEGSSSTAKGSDPTPVDDSARSKDRRRKPIG